MNIEIADRLVKLRKASGLSQEALAERLGISRQAVSKWERAEASPDTDNLIMLARLYGISLDDMLRTDGEVAPSADDVRQAEAEQRPDERGASEESTEDCGDTPSGKSATHVSFKNGIHVIDGDDEVHIDLGGIHVSDREDEVHIGLGGIHVNDGRYRRHRSDLSRFVPVTSLAIISAYFIIGAFWGLWHPGWLVFFLIPIAATLFDAIAFRNPRAFAFPVLTVALFLFAGFVFGWWKYAWPLFLTIPIYYTLPITRRRD